MIEMFYHGQETPAHTETLKGFENANGKGSIHLYPILDGVSAMLMQLEMQSYTEIRNEINVLEINFCVNGRFETSFSTRDHVLIKPGDMAISCYDGIHGAESESLFPLGYYEGICLEVCPEAAQPWIEKNASAFGIDFDCLKQNLLDGRWYMYGHAGPRCEHIFRELYENASLWDMPILQLKTLELLMLLSRIPRCQTETLYYSSKQAELARHLRDHLLTGCDAYVSLDRLAAEHGISVSHLQKLFKKFYGVPVYRYVKEYRLERAAVELVQTKRPITEIAQRAGYDNASKFTEAFKKRYGLTPSQYRAKRND